MTALKTIHVRRSESLYDTQCRQTHISAPRHYTAFWIAA